MVRLGYLGSGTWLEIAVKRRALKDRSCISELSRELLMLVLLLFGHLSKWKGWCEEVREGR